MKMTMITRQSGVKVQEPTTLSMQIKELNKNGIYPIESRAKAKMIVVDRSDLERATALKIDDTITIASRY